MGMGTNFNAMYKRTRAHLRKTKEKMIKPFDWKVGKKGNSLKKGAPLTEEHKAEIRKKIKKQNRIDLTINILKIVAIIFIMMLFLMWRKLIT